MIRAQAVSASGREVLPLGERQCAAARRVLLLAVVTLAAVVSLAAPVQAWPKGDVRHASGWVIATSTSDGYAVILHTTNGGRTWVRQGSSATLPKAGLEGVKAVDRDVAWAVGDPDGGYGVILRTANGGRTWLRCGRAGVIPNVALNGVAAVDRRTAWAVGDQGVILKTANGGRTWTTQASGTAANLVAVAAVGSRIVWVGGQTDGGYPVILRTTDGGRTWKRRGSASTLADRQLIDVAAVDARVAWGVGGSQTCVGTADGGRSWERHFTQGLPDFNGACAAGRRTLWIAADYGAMWRTLDAGAHWTRLVVGPASGFYLLGVSALDANHVWAVGAPIAIPPDRGIVMYTADGGTTWKEQSTPVSVSFRRVSFVGANK